MRGRIGKNPVVLTHRKSMSSSYATTSESVRGSRGGMGFCRFCKGDEKGDNAKEAGALLDAADWV